MTYNEISLTTAEKISKSLDQATGIACAFFFGTMTVIVFLGVFFRYVLNAPLNWVEETSRYLMIWGASLAISIGISQGDHVGLTIILDALKPGTGKKALILAINTLVFAFVVFMFVYSWFAAVESKTQMTQALGISMFIPKLAVPVAMLLSAIQVVLATIKALKGSGEPPAGSPGYIDI